MFSAAEVEAAGIFHNCTTALTIEHMLEALEHAQHVIPIKTDISTATSFSNSTLKEKRSKSWDMRLHWIKDRVIQNQFHIFWDKGINNYVDYPTKYFPPPFHRQNRPNYVLPEY